MTEQTCLDLDDDGYLESDFQEDDDLDSAWLCICGNFETSGYCCSCCGCEPPWGCDCGEHDEEYEEDWMEVFP